MSDAALAAFIERRIERIPWSGCWVWTGYANPKGYGRLCSPRTKDVLAHRVAWTAYRGPIPAGQLVLHRCDVRPCCNPAHLFLGTNGDNMADMVTKGRQASGERVRKGKLTVDAVRDIRSTKASAKEMALRYGVSEKTVYVVRQGKQWAHAQRYHDGLSRT